ATRLTTVRRSRSSTRIDCETVLYPSRFASSANVFPGAPSSTTGRSERFTPSTATSASAGLMSTKTRNDSPPGPETLGASSWTEDVSTTGGGPDEDGARVSTYASVAPPTTTATAAASTKG